MNKFGIGALSALGIGCIGAGAFCLAENAYSYGQQNATAKKDDVGQDVPAKLEDVLATFSGEYPGVVPEIVDVSDDKYVVLMGQSSYCYDNNTGDLTTINVVTQYNFFARVGDVPYFVNASNGVNKLCTFNGTSFETFMENILIPDANYTPFYTTDKLMLCYNGQLIVIDVSQKQVSTFSMGSNQYLIKKNKMYFRSPTWVDRNATINCLDLDTVTVNEGPEYQVNHGVDVYFFAEQGDEFQIVYQRDNVLYRYDGINEISMYTFDDNENFSSFWLHDENINKECRSLLDKHVIYFSIVKIADEQQVQTFYAYNIHKLELITLGSNSVGDLMSLYLYNTGVCVNYWDRSNSVPCNLVYDINLGLKTFDFGMQFGQTINGKLFYIGYNNIYIVTETETLTANMATVWDNATNFYSETIFCNNPISIQEVDGKYFVIAGDKTFIVELSESSIEVYTGNCVTGDVVTITSQYLVTNSENSILVVFDYMSKSITQFDGDYEVDSIDGDIVKLTSANGSEYELDLTTKTLTCTKLNITATN